MVIYIKWPVPLSRPIGWCVFFAKADWACCQDPDCMGKEFEMSESGDLWGRAEVLCERLLQLRDSL